MKRTIFLVLFSLVAQPCLTHAIPEQPAQTFPSPDEVTRQFYDWYLHARFPEPQKENEARFRRYVTKSFLERAMDPNADVVLFIAAQDADPTWADHFRVAKATIRDHRATTQVTLTGEKVHCTLRVILRRENGTWKIDNVTGVDWKSVGLPTRDAVVRVYDEAGNVTETHGHSFWTDSLKKT